MDLLILVDKGLEEIAQSEIKERTNKNGTIVDCGVIVNGVDETIAIKLAYKLQSAKRVIELKYQFKANNLDEIRSELEKQDIIVPADTRIECEREGTHDYNSPDVVSEVLDILEKKGIKTKKEGKTFYVYINEEKGYAGKDFSGRDLSKREYRIFVKPTTLKGTLAFGIIKESGYKKGEIIIDPYCETGVIAIEAALYASNKSVRFYKKEFPSNIDTQKIFDEEDEKIEEKIKNIYAYDKNLKNINSTKKNAKIAGVDKMINFSKLEVEWLDTKFEEKTVDRIVTKLPSESKKVSEKILKKLYEEFFYQVEFVLKNDGCAVVCVQKGELIKKHSKKMKVVSEKEFYSGQQSFKILTFKKDL